MVKLNYGLGDHMLSTPPYLWAEPSCVDSVVLKNVWVVTAPGGRHTQDIKLSLMGSK